MGGFLVEYLFDLNFAAARRQFDKHQGSDPQREPSPPFWPLPVHDNLAESTKRLPRIHRKSTPPGCLLLGMGKKRDSQPSLVYPYETVGEGGSPRSTQMTSHFGAAPAAAITNGAAQEL